jgi:phosphoglycolate phosphatase
MIEKLILFDIDGTLVLTGGAGKRGMTRAFDAVFGVADAFAGIELSGRTDTSILADAFECHHIRVNPDGVGRFRTRYLECLRDEVVRATSGKRVLPGISTLLEALHARVDSFLGLLTGNFAEAAEVKLGHFDLWRYFRCGAFGEDAHDRNQLVPIALDRARACGLAPHVAIEGVVIVGDTPRDVVCAQRHGARVIAVATGEYNVDELRRTGADVVFEDLSDTTAILAALYGARHR